jgi:hypothetical protein
MLAAQVATHGARGHLLQARMLARPVLSRLSLLYSVFRHTVHCCLDAAREVLSPKPPGGGIGGIGGGGGGAARGVPQSRVTQVAIDALYHLLLNHDQMSGRCAARACMCAACACM